MNNKLLWCGDKFGQEESNNTLFWFILDRIVLIFYIIFDKEGYNKKIATY